MGLVPWSLVLLRPLGPVPPLCEGAHRGGGDRCHHQLVPLHRVATAEERRTLGSVHLLPLLRSDDAIVRYLGLKTGEVVRIQRCDGSLYWRHIVGGGR